MMSESFNDKQRRVTIRYTELDTLLNREESMTKTLQNTLDNNGNVQEITDKYITVCEDDTFTLTFILTEIDE